MPQIEVLPLSTSARTQPGWAYVPDTSGAVPAAATQPGSRKRAARYNASAPSAVSANQLSSKQQKAIEQRLKDLDKENYREVHVPIPKREKSDAAEGARVDKQAGKKVSSNVRRILGYNRGFAHYLADEEAAIAVGGGGFVGTWGQGLSTSAAGGGSGTATAGAGAGRRERDEKRKSLSTPAPRGRGKRQSTTQDDAGVKAEAENVTMDGVEGASVPAQASATPSTSLPPPPGATAPPVLRYPPAYDADPLLKTLNLPPKPSDRVMAALLAEPPLSYSAARAKPLDEDKQLPRRHFCGVCGYWGKIKCRRCGERTCGLLECWKAHEVAGCVPY
jgi:zinc finger HIT domain-containing protein 1